MSQCVPSWDLEDGPSHHLQSHHPSSTITRSPMSDYEVAELTWENGHLAMHGHRGGTPRAGKPPAKDPSAGVPSWEKPRASGTLEAVVDQATRSVVPSAPAPAAQVPNSASGHLVPCLGAKNSYHPLRAPPVPATMDALVPCSNLRPHGGSGGDDPQPCRLVPDEAPGPADGGGGTCVASCSGRKRTRLGAGDGNCSVTGSAASMGLTFDTCEINGAGDDTGFATSASPIDGSPETENTSCGRPLAHADDHDSVCHSRRTQTDGCYEKEKIKGDMGRSSVSTKRSRAAAVHNQSERKRRDRINQKMKTLQKLVPNSSKTDKASILDEAIEYLKQLQAQVQMMSRMSSVHHMMMPMTMQHMQMAMMAQMGQMAQMGMGMGMGMMDMNTLGRAEQSGVAPVLSTAPPFPPPSGSWPDAPSGDRLQAPAGAAVLPGDPFAPFMAASQNQQPTTMDAYGRMAALYRQLHQQPPGPTSKT